jgi:hypothetical protein
MAKKNTPKKTVRVSATRKSRQMKVPIVVLQGTAKPASNGIPVMITVHKTAKPASNGIPVMITVHKTAKPASNGIPVMITVHKTAKPASNGMILARVDALLLGIEVAASKVGLTDLDGGKVRKMIKLIRKSYANG